MTARHEPVIGLEIHIQLATKTKLFCSCSTDYIGATPNSNVCPLCLGLPGTLPVPNGQAVMYAVRTALALGCTINERTIFHRKNYFYPDLPKAYQISQYDLPLAEHGAIVLTDSDGSERRIRIKRLHLEEDAGKLVHSAADGRLAGSGSSLVDYNRSGVPLAEIVSEPDIASPREAREYVLQLRRLVRYLGVCDGDLESGSLRVDANVSVRTPDGPLGTRTEIKNMNSLRALELGLHYEVERQGHILDDGGHVVQETRHWDDGAGVTRSSRGKEEAHDYRYFPEPDLPPIVVTAAEQESARAELPELPWERVQRYIDREGLSREEAEALSESREVAEYADALMAGGVPAERAGKWVKTEILRVLNEQDIGMAQFPVPADQLALLLKKVEARELSTTAARDVFTAMCKEQVGCDEAIEKAGVATGSVEGERLRGIVEKILSEHPDVLEEIRSGKDKKGKKQRFLQGQVMRETRGQADPGAIAEQLKELLDQ
ncbi:MAG: Asp-tRNA(Asn)/Glu-tRNA(Gln) amidotransferase subunit GatB [Synergistales bacterium]|nr:Asp-tRNA(Asn)/Glu-tRNA(Gln) amidotransferase subunit GatB [Synergistales bacterium]